MGLGLGLELGQGVRVRVRARARVRVRVSHLRLAEPEQRGVGGGRPLEAWRGGRARGTPLGGGEVDLG